MENFEEKLIEVVKQKIIKDISEMKFTDYVVKEKYLIPSELIKKAYASIDTEKILGIIKESLEEQIAKTIVNSMLTECVNDTKQLMSNNELRQQLKYRVYPQIIKMIEEGTSK